MIVFFVMSTLIVAYTKSEEIEKSSVFLYNSEVEDLKNYSFAKNNLLRNLQSFTCTDPALSCSNFGICNDQKTDCICSLGHITHPEDSQYKCNYPQKKQLVAFLLELFLGFGSGHFYSGRTTFGGLKLGAFLFGIYIICLFPLSAKCLSDRFDSECLVIAVSCFYYCCAVGLAFWFVYDLVMFGMNKYLDGEGLMLLPWGSQTN
jgi:hypothetical protein